MRNAEKMRLQIRYESARGGHPGYFQREGVSLETDLSPNSSLFKIKNRLTHQLARHSMKPWMYFGLFVFNNKPTYKSKKKQKLNFLQLFFKCFNRSYRCENFEVTECRSTERPQYFLSWTGSVVKDSHFLPCCASQTPTRRSQAVSMYACMHGWMHILMYAWMYVYVLCMYAGK